MQKVPALAKRGTTELQLQEPWNYVGSIELLLKDTKIKLTMIGKEDFDRLPAIEGFPAVYCVWDSVMLWPSPDNNYEMEVCI